MPDKCRSCGAAIIWATTEGGKAMPLDADPVPHDEGKIVLRDGVALVGTAALVQSAGPWYRSHFATCPDAASHRKPKAG